MIVLNTFCVDDTPVSIQPPLTTKDTKHMKDNAWPGRNGKKNRQTLESKQASGLVCEV